MGTAGLVSSNWKNSGNALFEDHQVASDEELVAAAKNGDAESFDLLCKRHTEKIFRTAHSITRNREDAEDAIQDCFLKAFLHLKGFDGRSRFSTWLTRIAMNAALMKLRKNRARREVPSEGPDGTSEVSPEARLTDAAPNPEERYATNEQTTILRDAIANLRPAIREVVEIRLQDCSFSQTARILGISSAAAKARLFHARVALRQGSRLHLVVPAGWTERERGLHAMKRAFPQGQRLKQQQRSAVTLEQEKFAGMEVKS